MEMGILDQQELTKNAAKERALVCVISCNGQSSLEVPCLLTSPGQLYHLNWVFTGCQGADFPSDLGNPSRSLCQNVVFLSKWKFVGNNPLSIKKILFDLFCQHDMLPLHEATGPRLGQGCRTTQQEESEICCLFLWWPTANSQPAVQELPACPPLQASGSASAFQRSAALERALGWVRRLHRGSQRQTSAIRHFSWPPQERWHLLITPALPAFRSGPSVPPSCTLTGTDLKCLSQHTSAKPPGLRCSYTSLAQLRQGMHPTTPAAEAGTSRGLLLVCNILLVIPLAGGLWLLN